MISKATALAILAILKEELTPEQRARVLTRLAEVPGNSSWTASILWLKRSI